MKKILTILGGIFLILIAMVVMFIGYSAYNISQLSASAKTYVDACVPTIISSWSKDELLKRASPQFHQASSDEQIAELFTTCAEKTGAFRSYDGSTGNANVAFTTKNGKTITAVYTATATFEGGKFDMKINLVQVNGQWLINGFYVDRHKGASGQTP